MYIGEMFVGVGDMADDRLPDEYRLYVQGT